MYRFKYYFKDGTTEISGAKSQKPEDLWFDFDGLVDFEEYDKIRNMKLSIHEVLEKAFDLYKKIYKDYYKIEIIDDSTNEVVDYIEESEVR